MSARPLQRRQPRRRPDPSTLTPEVRALVRAQLGRRSVLRGMGAAGVGLGLAACGTGGSSTGASSSEGPAAAEDLSAEEQVVNWANWTLYLDVSDDGRSYPSLEAFEEQTGITANYSEDIDGNDSYYGRIQGQLANGDDIGQDIVVFTDWMAARMIRLGYTQKLDAATIPNKDNILPNLADVDFDPGRNNSLTWQSGFAGIAWNKEQLPDGLTSVSDLWRPELKGRVEVLDEMRDTVGLILLEQGVDISGDFTDDQFGAALAELEKQVESGQIRQVVGNSYKEDLVSGDALAVIGWSGDITQINFESGDRWEFALPDSGGTLWSDNMMIPIGSPHKTNAETLMNYYYDPEVAAQVAAWVNYICPVQGAQEAMMAIDPELAEDPFIFPTDEFLSNVSIFTQPDAGAGDELQRAVPAGDRSVTEASGAGLVLSCVTKAFGDAVAVDAIDLDVPAGSFFALLGPSGCGKTTTLRMVAGLEHPDSGSITIGGKDVTWTKPYQRPVNTVFQSYALFPHLDVLDNVMFGLRRRKVADARARAMEALELVELAQVADKKPAQLSGGMQQRVALARAVVNRPDVLLLDEPLGALDLKLRRQMQTELKRIQTEVGLTFIHVTHDQEEAMTMADTVAVMNAGHIEQLGPPEQLYDHPATAFTASFLGQCNLLPATVTGVGSDRVDVRPDMPGAVAGSGTSGLVVSRRRCPEAVAVGDEVLLGVRPEKVSLLSDGGGSPTGSDVLGPARVVDRSYTGVSMQYLVDLPGAGRLSVFHQNVGDGVDPSVGDEVHLCWAVEHGFLLPGHDVPVLAEEQDPPVAGMSAPGEGPRRPRRERAAARTGA